MSTWTPSAMQSPRARWATAMRETRGATRVSALRNINEHSLRVNECGRDHPQRRIVYLPPSPHVYFIIRKHKPRTRNRRTDDARRERETDGREGETERGMTARGALQTVPVARTESCSMSQSDGGRTCTSLTHSHAATVRKHLTYITLSPGKCQHQTGNTTFNKITHLKKNKLMSATTQTPTPSASGSSQLRVPLAACLLCLCVL